MVNKKAGLPRGRLQRVSAANRASCLHGSGRIDAILGEIAMRRAVRSMSNVVAPISPPPAAAWLLAVASVLPAFDAEAAGFGLDDQGAREVGMATAGGAAAQDATTIFYNVAGLNYLERDQIVGGGQLLFLHDRFSNTGSTILDGSLATPGGNGGDAIPFTAIPWAYGSYRLSDEVVAGAGLFAPFGLKSEYQSDFVGRYQNLRSALEVIDLEPALAWRPEPWLSLGAGFDVQYSNVNLTQAIDFGSLCVTQLGAGTCSSAFGLTPGGNDGRAHISANDFAIGYNLGLIVEPLQGSRVGFAYRSEVDHHYNSASERFDVPANARAFLDAAGLATALTGSQAYTDLPLPARATFSLAQSLPADLTFLADATMTRWGVLRQTVITATDTATGVNVLIPQHYQNANRYAVGTNWAPKEEAYELRAGFAYDETPIPTAFVQAALPDRNRVYITFGGSYRITNDIAFDVGLALIQYLGPVPINRATVNGDQLRGSFNVGGEIVAAQLKFEF
jgi:long-chain fatty acid transport protein